MDYGEFLELVEVLFFFYIYLRCYTIHFIVGIIFEIIKRYCFFQKDNNNSINCK